MVVVGALLGGLVDGGEVDEAGRVVLVVVVVDDDVSSPSSEQAASASARMATITGAMRRRMADGR